MLRERFRTPAAPPAPRGLNAIRTELIARLEQPLKEIWPAESAPLISYEVGFTPDAVLVRFRYKSESPLDSTSEASARHKVARAKHHVKDLTSRAERWRSENPYEIVVEEDPEPGYKIHKLRLTKKVDLAPLSVIIGGAVTNLRAALDHSVYACAIAASGGKPPILRACNFPFGPTVEAFENAIGGCTAVPQEIRACLSRFKAYKGGNVESWALNSMCNWDKHALITPVVVVQDFLVVLPIIGEIEPPNTLLWESTKNEIELVRTKGEPYYNFALILEVAFDGSSALPLKPLFQPSTTLSM